MEGCAGLSSPPGFVILVLGVTCAGRKVPGLRATFLVPEVSLQLLTDAGPPHIPFPFLPTASLNATNKSRRGRMLCSALWNGLIPPFNHLQNKDRLYLPFASYADFCLQGAVKKHTKETEIPKLNIPR